MENKHRIFFVILVLKKVQIYAHKHQNTFGGRTPPGRLRAPPDPIAAIEGVLLLRGGKGRRERGERKGEYEKGRRGDGKGGRDGMEGMCPLTLSPGSASDRCHVVNIT